MLGADGKVVPGSAEAGDVAGEVPRKFREGPLRNERWTLLIVRELVAGSERFNELRRGVPRMSPTLLSKRLNQLVRAGVVDRRGDGDDVRYA